MGKQMKQPAHPFFRLPGSLFWLLPLVAAMLLYWEFDGIGTLWWYLTIPPLIALALLDLFSTVWLGITILISLFLYCSIGSSGVPISFAIWEPTAWLNLREIRLFEMTEFEWFHWWPFKSLIAFLCLNMTIVTIRKIPFTILTLGVWTIHTGIIVLVLGCVVYFSQKIEGDVLISRRRVVIQVPDDDSVSMVVTPSNSITVGDTTYKITDINPNWELMSGDDAGTRAYTVTVSVEGPDESFMRQLIAGYPQYTEDIVRTDDPEQPMARAKTVVGRALVDELLQMSLEYDIKDDFLLTQSGALYLRELSASGTPKSNWIERPIDNLPRFNDYISEYDDVWLTGGTPPTLHPLAIIVKPTSVDDPVEQDIVVTSYLRYAFLKSQTIGGGNYLFPSAWVTLRKGDAVEQPVQMFAFDPSSSTADASLMTFKWLNTNEDLNELQESLFPTLYAVIDGKNYPLEIKNTQEFQPIGDSEYAFRVQAIQNDLNINGLVVSLAQVEIQRGDETWVRWVFDNQAMNRDVIEGENHEGAVFVDDAITMTYSPGAAPITIIGGIEEDEYTILIALTESDLIVTQLKIGTPVTVTDDVTLTLDRVEAFTVSETRPSVIPQFQRDPSANNTFSMLQVIIPANDETVTVWLPYHHYPFESNYEVVRRFQYTPTILQLPNGTLLEMMFSRRRAPLGYKIALDSFEIDSHLGGFTGRTPSILNWRSLVHFLDGTDTKIAVSVNDPKRHGEFWFFQSQWDPPDSASPGLNYTVLGVGNRHGVFQMLFGSCLAVSGMIWAFFVKPMIKRKRQRAEYKGIAS